MATFGAGGGTTKKKQQSITNTDYIANELLTKQEFKELDAQTLYKKTIDYINWLSLVKTTSCWI